MNNRAHKIKNNSAYHFSKKRMKKKKQRRWITYQNTINAPLSRIQNYLP